MASIYTAFDDMAGPLTAPAEKKLEGMPQAEACGAPCVKIATCASASCSLSLCLAVSLSRCLSLSLSLSLSLFLCLLPRDDTTRREMAD